MKRRRGVSTAGGEVRSATTPAPLRPRRQREQNQAERRYVQPAPHTAIIAQVVLFSAGENSPLEVDEAPTRSLRNGDDLLGLPYDDLPYLAFFLSFALSFAIVFAAGFAGLAAFSAFFATRAFATLLVLASAADFMAGAAFSAGTAFAVVPAFTAGVDFSGGAIGGA